MANSKGNCCKYFTASLVPVASLILAILFALGIVALPILYVHLAHEYKYGVVIDAGSSHTNTYFYRWDIPRYRDTGDIDQIHHCYTYQSLNSYTRDPSKAGNVVSPCIDQSMEEDYIPKSQRSTTPIFLGATAGMRLVRRKDPHLSDHILASVNSSLKKSDYHLSSGRIITGQEEAVSGWITGNFLSDGLKKDRSLTGSLDLGGASTEIAFKHSQSDQSQYQTSVRLYERDYSLYARSYLCYGLNEAHLRLLGYLVNTTANGAEPIQNPCLLKGALLTYDESDIFSSECVNHNSSDIFGFGFSAPPHSALSANEAANVTFNGTGDPAHCNNIIHEVFDLANCSDPSICIGKDYFWPPVNNSGTFLGMSGFYEVARFFNSSGVELRNLTMFNQTVHSFCNLTNSSASGWYPDNPYFQRMCFNGVFSLFLLQTGFGFNSSNTHWTLMFINKVNKKDVGWAMGYLVNQTTTISDDPHQVQRPFQSVDLVVGIVVLSILCVVFVIFFFLTFHACRKVLKIRSSGYAHIS